MSEASRIEEAVRATEPESFDLAALMQAMGQYDWRYSESPLVDGNKVIVTPGSNAALIVALDKSSGERTHG